MKLLRSLLRIAATVCICMAVIVGVTIAVRPRVIKDWPGDYAADVRLPADVTPVMFARADSQSLPLNAAAAVESNDRRSVTGANTDWVLADSQPAPAVEPIVNATVNVPQPPRSETFNVEIPARTSENTIELKPEASDAGFNLRLEPETSFNIKAEPKGSRVRIDAGNGTALEVDSIGIGTPDTTSGEKSERAPGENSFESVHPAAAPKEELPSPRIEPSTEGTVYTLNGPRNFTIEVGGKLLLASQPVESLSGFDARVIQVKAEGPRRITIEAVKTGITAIQVQLAGASGRMFGPFSVQVQVTGAEYGSYGAAQPYGAVEPYGAVGPDGPVDTVTRTPLVHPSIDGVSEPPQPMAILEGGGYEAVGPGASIDALPAIEPSEVGTIIPLDGSALSLSVDGAQVVESELRIRRVSGFDAKLIRITALSPTRLKVEGLSQGRTSIWVEYNSSQLAGMVVDTKVVVQVGPKPVDRQLSIDTKTYEPDEALYASPLVNLDARSATVSPSPRTEAEDTLRELYPKAGLEFVWLRDALVLRGWVENANDIPQIMEVAEVFAPKVFNQLGVRDATTAPTDDQAAAPHIVVLKLPGDRGSTLAPRQRVDVIEQRVVRNQTGREEAMERKIAENVEVADVHIGSGEVIVHLLVSEETGFRLSDIDPARLQVVPHDETTPVPGNDASNRSITPVTAVEPAKTLGVWTMRQPVDVVRLGSAEIPMMVVVENAELSQVRGELVQLSVTEEQASILRSLTNEKLAVIPHSTDGHALHRLKDVLGIHTSAVTGKPMELPGTPIAPSAAEATGTEIDAVEAPSSVPESISLSKECRVAITPAGKLDIATCAKCHSDVQQLNLQLNGADDPLRDDIRALHDDVRRLITLLEKRTALQPPAAEGLTPQAAAWQAMFNEWGRAVLKKDYARALAVADGYLAKDPDHHNYKSYSEKARQAISTGTINHPMLVVAMAKWSAPCQHVQPLLLRRQNSGLPMVVLDADVEADAELINQLNITAFPTLLWTVDGRKLAEQVGVVTEDEFNKLFRTVVSKWAASHGDQNVGELDLGDPQVTSPPAETLDDLESPPKAPVAPELPDQSMTGTDAADRETAEFEERTWWLVGIRFTPLSENAPQLRDRFGRGGLLVDEVRPDSPAAKAKIESGDVIIGVRKWETTDEQDFGYAIEDSVQEGVWEVEFHFVRNGRRLSTQVAFEIVELESPPDGTAANEEPVAPPESTAAARASDLNPTAAARKKLLDEIGRVILRRDYPRALELSETYEAADLIAEFAAMEKIGPENVPVVVVATAPWSAPCRALQPLLTQLQNDGYGLVILDSDDAADAKLIQQLKIDAFPTLACVVDGSKKAELVGVFSHTDFDRFVNQFRDTIQELLDRIESKAGESKPGIEADIPAATSQTLLNSHGDVRAVDFDRTFRFSVGFAR